MTATQAFTLAAIVAAGFLAMWLLKKGALAFFNMQIKHQIAALACVSAMIALIFPSFVPAFLVTGTVIFSFWGWLMKKGGGFSRNKGFTVIRGNQLVDKKVVQKMVAGYNFNVSIADVPLPKHLETRHILAAGTTGAGKTQFMHQILRPVREKGERAVVPDVGGENLSIYYRDGDAILNPFDARGKSWSPLAEMRGEYDGIRLAKSIIPDGQGSAKEWNGYAQKILSAVLVKVWESDGNNGDIVRWCVTESLPELKRFLAGSPVEGMFASVQADGSAKGMITEARGILSSYIEPMQYLDERAGAGSFSVRNWMREDSEAWLFMPFADSQFESLRTLIAAWLDIAISGLLDLDENDDRRIWFVVDEFATFGEMNSMVPLLTRGRRYGGCAVLGVQTISQIFDSYGQDKAQTLLSCLGTQLVLRCPDAKTSEAFSLLFGEQDIGLPVHSTSTNGADVNRSQSIQYTNQRVVLPSEIQNLPDRIGFLNIVGDIPPCAIEVPVTKKVVIAERFVPKARAAKAKAEEPKAEEPKAERFPAAAVEWIRAQVE